MKVPSEFELTILARTERGRLDRRRVESRAIKREIKTPVIYFFTDCPIPTE